MKKIYIAGPMRGKPNWNRHSFDLAKGLWMAAGWLVFSPACLVRALGYPDEGIHNSDRAHLNHVFQIDFACLFACDAIALLPGWERSTGATAELALAQVLGLEVYDAITREQISVQCIPWHGGMEKPPYRVLTSG